jgi:hypothetical protein
MEGIMKRAFFVVSLLTLGLSSGAFAQSPNDSGPSGPHDPNPPMNAPDLRLPPPCGSAPNGTQVAAGTSAATLASAQSVPPQGNRVADTECAASGTATTTAPSPAHPSLK